MPEKKIRDFAASVKKLVVVEELEGFIESHCRDLGLDCLGKEAFPCIGELMPLDVAEKLATAWEIGVKLGEAIPPRPPVMCAGCPHRGLFYILKKNKLTVLGDIGCYTLGAVAPLGAVDSVICMGASVSGLHGFSKSQQGAMVHKTVAVIGDSTFMHSGITGLVNMAYNESNATVIIVDNSITGMTGHQQNPTTGFNLKGDPCAKIDLETLCRSVGIRRVRVVDPYDLEQCDAAIKEELSANEPSVIISRRPCALLKYVKHKAPLVVDEAKCVGCKACMKIGCPAVSIVGGKAKIDNTLCVGCGVCQQLCKVGALGAKED
jgi:indolepyruvate ferredoxin oxidoreductase alpha subunit